MKTIILFSILLFHVTFVNCAYNATSYNKPTNYATNSAANSAAASPDPNMTRADSKLMIATGLILSQIDLIACIYVLVRTYLQWKQNRKNSLPMSLRFPFYIALIEIWVSILQTVGLANSNPSGGLCSFIGLFSVFLLGFTGNLVTLISFIVWYKVKKNVDVNSGRYDYLIFLPSSILATFYALLGVGEIGPSKFWCSPNPLQKPILYMILAIIIIHFIILLILYMNARINLIRLNVNLSSSSEQQTLSEREIIIARKTSAYTLAFVFQLTILLFCAIFATVTTENSAIHLLRMLGISIGGLLIALQYIINEGWKHVKITSPPLIEKTSSGLNSTVSSLKGSIQRPFTRIQVQVVQQQTTTQNDDFW